MTFANLFHELQATVFELDSLGQTIKQHLGEREAQDKETNELVKEGKVPRQVYLYLRFLAAREIQRKRTLLFQQGAPTLTIKQWKAKLRDDTRRRLRSFLLGQSSAVEEEKIEEQSGLGLNPAARDSLKTARMQRKKAAAKDRGENFNKTSQQRKRQRRAEGSSSKKPEIPLCDQAKELIEQFDKLVDDYAKHGDLVQSIVEQGKPTPTKRQTSSAS